jgi:hypothetical protein
MRRILLLSAAAFCLTTVAAIADAATDRAIRTFQSVGYNPYKLNTYCQMAAVVESQGEREDEAADAALEPYLDKLGTDFEEAWETAEEADENSVDGKRIEAALEALDDRCPGDDGDDGDDDGADDAADDAEDASDAADTVIDILGND